MKGKVIFMRTFFEKKQGFMMMVLVLLLGLSGALGGNRADAATRKCYTICTSNTRVYSNSSLTSGIGWIYPSDEITVNTVTDRYCYVSYPISGGRTKSGYIATGAVLTGTTGNSYRASGQIATYRRDGGASYGHISSGDTVTVLGTRGNYTQVKYPVSGGYKYAFISSDNANRYLYGNSGSGSNNNRVSAPLPDGVYTFYTAINGSYALDIYNGYGWDGNNVQLSHANGGNFQKFRVVKNSEGYYTVTSVGSGKLLDVAGAGKTAGTNVWQYSANGTAAQQWQAVSLGNGYYTFISRCNGLALDVNGGVAAFEQNIQVWSPNGTDAQKWRLAADSNNNKKQITVFSQRDSRWKDKEYGKGPNGKKATLDSSGCGILSYVNAVYYMTGNMIDPSFLADWSVQNGYRINGVGTSGGLYRAFADRCGSDYGFRYIRSASNIGDIRSDLQNGRTAILGVEGHLIACVSYENGKYLILDSYASSGRGTQSGYRWLTAAEFTGKLKVYSIHVIGTR